MIDTGSIIISHETGWACAKECRYGFDVEVLPDKTARKTMTVEIPKGLFNCVGEAKGTVKAMILLDNGSKLAFTAKMQGKTKLLVQGEVNNNFNTIIKEIKSWQSIKENY